MAFLTYVDKIKALVGSDITTDFIQTWTLSTGRWVLQLLPDTYLSAFCEEIPAGNGYSTSLYRAVYAKNGSVPARKVSAMEGALASQAFSLHRATAIDPVWWEEGGLTRAFPTDTLLGVCSLSVVVDDETGEITGTSNLSSECQEAIMYGVAGQWLTKKVNDTISNRPALPASVVSNVAWQDVAFSFGPWPPHLPVDFNDYHDAATTRTALETAMTDEDIELGRSRLEELNILFAEWVGEWERTIKSYLAIYEQTNDIAKFNAAQAAQVKLAAYRADVERYASTAQAWLSEVQALRVQLSNLKDHFNNILQSMGVQFNAPTANG